MRPWPLLIALVALGLLTSCGRLGAPAPPRPGLLVASDLPGGLVRCAGSGDMQSYLNGLQLSSPGKFEATAHGWQAAQDAGALSADVALYADRTADCALLHDIGADMPYRPRLAFSLAYRFASSRAAADAYRFSAIGQGGVLDGTRVGSSTGLGPNATTISQQRGDRSYFLAFWQRGRYAIDFFAINLDGGLAQAIVARVDARSH